MEHGGKIIPRGVRTGINLNVSQINDVTLTNLRQHDVLSKSTSGWVNDQPIPYAKILKSLSNPVRTAAQTPALITFETALTDPYSMWDDVTNTFTVPFDGIWEYSISVQFTAAADGYRQLFLEKNDGHNIAIQKIAATSSGSVYTYLSVVDKLYANETLQATFQHNSATSLGILSNGVGASNAYTSLRYLGRSD